MIPIPLTGHAGPCLVVEARYCAEAKLLTLTSPGIKDVFVALSVPAGSVIFAPGAGSVVSTTRVFTFGTASTSELLLKVLDSAGGSTLWAIWGAHGPIVTTVKIGGVITKTTGEIVADQPDYTLLITAYRCDKNSLCQMPDAVLKEVFGL